MISLQQTDSPVPLVVTVKLIGPMLAERTALMVLPTIRLGAGRKAAAADIQRCRVCQGTAQAARRSRSASFVRQRLNILFSRGGYQRCCWRPLHAGYAHAV